MKLTEGESFGDYFITQPPKDVVRAKLLEDLFPCDKAKANILKVKLGEIQSGLSQEITIADPLGTVGLKNMYAVDPTGTNDWYIPAGTCIYCWDFDGYYEPLSYGDCCVPAGTSSEESSESSSESSESSEECFPVTGHSTSFYNYNPTVKQVLGHDQNGCWTWFDVGSC